jgi:hypothetical protein
MILLLSVSLSQNILLGILFSDIRNLYSSLRARDLFSKTRKAIGKIVITMNFVGLGRQGMLFCIPGRSLSIHHRFDDHKTGRPLGI